MRRRHVLRGCTPSPRMAKIPVYYVVEKRVTDFSKEPCIHLEYKGALKDYFKTMDVAIDLRIKPCYVLLSEIRDGRKIPLRDYGEKSLL